MSPKAVLIGLPGTGKTTTGRRLAKILAVPFADSDELVEAAAGRTVADFFAESGEAAFRAAESAAVTAALAEFPGVLALGGGALGNADTRAALADAGVPVVLLRAALGALAARVGDGASRPLLSADPRGRLAALAAERAPTYEEVATFAVETDHNSPAHVAAAIAARLHEREAHDARRHAH
jgi:shikimate kinase